MVYRITRWVCNAVKENAEITLDLRAYRKTKKEGWKKKDKKGKLRENRH